MRHRLTRRADTDIEHILEETLRAFGPTQVQAYAQLIDRAIAMVAEVPERPSSQGRPDLGPGIRSFHVALASGRRRSASHILYFTITDAMGGEREVVILRVLHDRMEPRLRLTSATAAEGNADEASHER
ncbi:UNVERIFIED_CONTAM: type II toxin-antitoxin system RelE/ParE family toxin [Methylobacteriaceae bacterium AG10]|nr:type II toxin-antitoxin system RelE/ParE family toxin [Methylobacteriaceae bacterium AG10]